ncbi:membrane-associated progesterone-binding protein 4 isoform X2 [Brassica napus]|uniref:membrane-associated progesterone-binding protein 4 isoform X2 n=1 Tax=Brassica oleracea var. oleracea TaxID=109376 RepID=UPI0006A6E563|nr:PREDICTED: membrane-associated progesterone-binding protein 4 isoform X2 [Brassica oleracea var. oleracea]XP_013698767.1 membrane-associated progesterone-binding protein 4 isoform X2 [Brassica napus]
MMSLRRILLSPFVGVSLIVVLLALYFRSSFKSPPQHSQRLFSAEELALYNGTDETLPILLGILGDASRAFVSGNFTGDGLTDSLHGLSSSEVKSIVDWRGFYARTYTPVGKLVGRYYDRQGNPTKHLKGAEAKASRGAQLMEKQKIEEDKQKNCNSRWSQDEGGEVWCDVGVPRLVQRPLEIAITGSMSKRCACFEEDQLDQSGLEIYKDCEPLAKTCKV